MNANPFNQENRERQILIKFGSILKKRVQRWYYLDKERQAIVYFSEKYSLKQKGAISLNMIVKASIAPENSDKSLFAHRGNQRSLILLLKSKKMIYLFQPNLEQTEELFRYIFQMMGFKVSQPILIVTNLPEIKNKLEDKFLLQDNPDFVQLTPLSNQSRNKQLTQSIQELSESYLPIDDETSKKIPHLSNNGQQRKPNTEVMEISDLQEASIRGEQLTSNSNIKNSDSNKENEEIGFNYDDDSISKDEEEERYMKFNQEIMEVLSKEETENTNRAHVFKKYQSLNDVFQIQKIKKQIYHSSHSLNKAASKQSTSPNITKNMINSHNFTIICQSSNNNNNNSNQSYSSDKNKEKIVKQLPTISQIGKNNNNNFSSRDKSPDQLDNEYDLGPEFRENSERIELDQIDKRDYFEGVKTVMLDSELAKHNSQSQYKSVQLTPQETNHLPFTKEASHYSLVNNGETQNQSSIKRRNNEFKTDTFRNFQKGTIMSEKMSVSEIEQESNLASIKQFQGDMQGKRCLQETFVQELRGCFRAQTYLYHEFNTLISLNTQYMGSGSNNKKNQTNNSNANNLNNSKKRDSFLTTMFNLNSMIPEGQTSEKRRKISAGSQQTIGKSLQIWEENGENSMCFSDDQEILTDKEVNRISQSIKDYSHSGRIVNCFKTSQSELISNHFKSSLSSSLNVHHPRLVQVPIEKYQLNQFQSDCHTIFEPESRTQIDNLYNHEILSPLEEQNIKVTEHISCSIKNKSETDFQLPLSAKGKNGNSIFTRSPSIGIGTKLRQVSSLEISVNNNGNNHNFSNNQNIYLGNFSSGHNLTSAYQQSPISSHRITFSPQISMDVYSQQPEGYPISIDELSNIQKQSVGEKIQLSINYLLKFQFLKAQEVLDKCIEQENEKQDDPDVVLMHIYILLVQFFFSLKINLLEEISSYCELGISITLSQRYLKNVFICLAQDAYLAEIYAIKGIILFILDKKIQGLFSLKNAYKYLNKCEASSPEVLRNLSYYHKSKIEILEGLYNLSACALQVQYQKVLSFFGTTFDSQRGLFLLQQIASRNSQVATFCPQELQEQKVEYLKMMKDKGDIDVSSHISVFSLALFYIWRQKDASPAIKIVQNQVKQYPSSPIYLWLSYQINFEQKDNIKALNQLNKSLLKCHSFRSQCISLKFEKAGFLACSLLWKEASALYGPIAVQLLAFDGFNSENFLSILKKNGILSSSFISYFRSNHLEYKAEKIFFFGISNLLLSQAAALISLGDIEQSKEWLLLSLYFKKSSYLKNFISQDMHKLSLLLVKRKIFCLVKYEIMYFTKTITKIPSTMISQILDEMEFSVFELFNPTKNEVLSQDSIKAIAVEKASYLLLKTLAGCLLCDSSIIQECENSFDSLEDFSHNKKYSEHQYLMHHGYYWIAKFYMLYFDFPKSLKNLKSMSKYSCKIFSLSQQAEQLQKEMQSF